MPLMMSSLDITSPHDFTIYKDQVFYSHDGFFVFLLILNKDGYLEKMVVAHNEHLSIPDTHEVMLIEHRIHCKFKALTII